MVKLDPETLEAIRQVVPPSRLDPIDESEPVCTCDDHYGEDLNCEACYGGDD